MIIPPTHADAVRMYGPEFARDQAGFYAKVRAERGPVTPALLVGDVPAWLVTSYREVLYVCQHPEIFGRDGNRWNLWPQIPGDWPLLPPVFPLPSVLHSEGAEHARRAGVISDVLEGCDRLRLAGLCEQSADELIDEFSGDGRADLIAQYTQRLTPLVLARLLGFPEEQIPALNRDLIVGAASNEDAAAAAQRGLEILGAFAADLCARAADRKNQADQRSRAGQPGPGGGLGLRLARHPAALTEEELTMDLFALFGLGQQSTANWIGSALRLTLSDEDFSLSLRGGRASLEQALTEVLWYDPPIPTLVGRWAVRDVELGGHRIGKGDMVCVGLASANAEQLALAGPGFAANRSHLAFAHGEHSCPVGAPGVAETIAKTAVEVLLDRLPDARLSVPADELTWNESTWLRSLESLPVTFTPAVPLP